MNDKTVGDRIRYSKQFISVLQTRDASPLLGLSPDKRIHILKSLSYLSQFLGCHERFMELKRRHNLTWTTGTEKLDALSLFFDDSKTIDSMLSWIRQAISVLPTDDMAAAIKWNCVTGLRPNESLASLRLIKSSSELNNNYYDPDGQLLLCHYKLPKIFFRRNKTAYVSIVDKELLTIAQNIGKVPPTKP